MKRADGGRAIFDWLWFVGWGAASSACCVTAARELSATFDEPFYVASGLAFWRTGSHYSLLKKGTMPLPVDLVTLPLSRWERWHGVAFTTRSDLEQLLPWPRAGTLGFRWLLLAHGRAAGRHLAGPRENAGHRPAGLRARPARPRGPTDERYRRHRQGRHRPFGLGRGHAETPQRQPSGLGGSRKGCRQRSEGGPGRDKRAMRGG